MTNSNRIAVCISGQIRTSNEKLKEISKKATEVGADVFISVWKERAGKTVESGPRHISILRIFGGKVALFFPRDWIYQFETLFPDWKDILPSRRPVTEAELLEIFPTAIVEIEDDRPELDLPEEKNSLRMLYKIFRCNLLKKSQEETQGFKYDRVIRVRPDMLVDFSVLAKPDLNKNDLLVLLRRGNSVHDKYWAGSSETDNTMAGLYEYSLEYRLGSWKGIHEELAGYVAMQGFNLIWAQATISDFVEFGGYVPEEKCSIANRFIEKLEDKNLAARADIHPTALTIATSILQNARGYSCFETSILPDLAVVAQLEALLEDSNKFDKNWSLLPVVTLAFACDLRFATQERANFAYHVLLDDALTWTSWLGFRIQNIVQILPECGTELLPLLSDSDRLPNLESRGDLSTRLAGLWEQRWAEIDQDRILKGHSDISTAFLKSGTARAAIHEYLSKKNRSEELLTFVRLLVERFPKQKNIKVLLTQTERLLNQDAHKDKP